MHICGLAQYFFFNAELPMAIGYAHNNSMIACTLNNTETDVRQRCFLYESPGAPEWKPIGGNASTK